MTRKHEANIKKNQLINIQLWIIALLSFSYFMYEVHMYIEPNNPVAMATTKNTDDNIYTIGPVTAIPNNIPITVKTASKIEKKSKTISETTPKVTTKPTEITTKITKSTAKPLTENTKGNNSSTSNSMNNSNNAVKSTAVKVSKTVYSKRTVDFLPVFPGCDKYSTNDERAICFEKKVQRLISRKFNNGLGEELGLSGKQKIHLYFEIDENGIVSNIKARSNTKGLEKEAIRVAKLLPKMEPARSGINKVKMSYNVPIRFLVH